MKNYIVTSIFTGFLITSCSFEPATSNVKDHIGGNVVLKFDEIYQVSGFTLTDGLACIGWNSHTNSDAYLWKQSNSSPTNEGQSSCQDRCEYDGTAPTLRIELVRPYDHDYARSWTYRGQNIGYSTLICVDKNVCDINWAGRTPTIIMKNKSSGRK